MKRIYVIGAQCTGKTTLVEAVRTWMSHNQPHISFATIQETARTILQLHHFSRDDVRAGGARCALLQKLILQSQIETEEKSRIEDLVISDRSGVDPLVYARIYCGENVVQDMLQSPGWPQLESRLRTGTVIVCEPVEKWLYDDGVRLMPKNGAEWLATHMAFCDILQQRQIPHTVLPASIARIDDRIQFVLSRAGIVDNQSDCRTSTGSPQTCAMRIRQPDRVHLVPHQSN